MQTFVSSYNNFLASPSLIKSLTFADNKTLEIWSLKFRLKNADLGGMRIYMGADLSECILYLTAATVEEIIGAMKMFVDILWL